MISKESSTRKDDGAEKRLHRFLELWNIMDMHDEHRTVKLAKNVAKVKDQVATRGKVHPEEDKPPQKKRMKPPQPPKPEHDFSLTFPLTLSTVEDAMVKFGNGKKISYRSVEQLIDLVRPILSHLPNLNPISINKGHQLTVCGDIHGQLEDLFTVFKKNGLPSQTNMYLFNGDFVDRGPRGLEVVVVLLCFVALFPSSMFLNRGNHESRSMNARYSFEDQVIESYDAKLYKRISGVFCLIPLGAIIEKKALVIHGGLFSHDDVLVEHINNQIDRRKEPPTKSKNRCDDIFTDILWSDPRPITGREKSDRGAGVHFGVDVTRKFLSQNKLDVVIRSHEMMQAGYEIQHEGTLVTVFSASNYCGSNDNQGAYIIIKDAQSVELSKMVFCRYRASDLENIPRAQLDPKKVEAETISKIRERIFESVHGLEKRFKAIDSENTGKISVQQWAQALREELRLDIDWEGLAEMGYLLKKKERNDKEEQAAQKQRRVKYVRFLRRFKIQVADEIFSRYDSLVSQICVRIWQSLREVAQQHQQKPVLVLAPADSSPAAKGDLKRSFSQYDKDGSGSISVAEFTQIIRDLNTGISDEAIGLLVRTIDKNSDGRISLHEYLDRFTVVYARTMDKQAEDAKFLSEACEKIAAALKKQGPDGVLKVFEAADKHAMKRLSYKDFSNALKSLDELDFSHEQRYQIAQYVDADQNQYINYEEFVNAFRISTPATQDDRWKREVANALCAALWRHRYELKSLFRDYDTDGSGGIDRLQFKELLTALNILMSHPLTDLQIAELFNMFDTDGSGEIDYEEFQKIVDSFEVVEMD